MFYLKNLRTWESVVRVIAGAGMALAGALAFHNSVLGWGLAAMGAVFVLTGVFGWCPMCAMVGRKL